ncbi:response regulator [Desulfonatronum parangueonense]
MPKVMVADDSMFQRFTLVKMLKNLEYEVIEAKDGQECLDSIARETPDALLLDLNMPIRNGFEVLETLQSQGADFPILVISADIQESSRQRCLDLGAKAVLSKPVLEQTLARTLAELTGPSSS